MQLFVRYKLAGLNGRLHSTITELTNVQGTAVNNTFLLLRKWHAVTAKAMTKIDPTAVKAFRITRADDKQPALKPLASADFELSLSLLALTDLSLLGLWDLLKNFG